MITVLGEEPEADIMLHTSKINDLFNMVNVVAFTPVKVTTSHVLVTSPNRLVFAATGWDVRDILLDRANLRGTNR